MLYIGHQNGDTKEFQSFLKSVFSKNDKDSKCLFFTGDFNMNLLDFEINKLRYRIL